MCFFTRKCAATTSTAPVKNTMPPSSVKSAERIVESDESGSDSDDNSIATADLTDDDDDEDDEMDDLASDTKDDAVSGDEISPIKSTKQVFVAYGKTPAPWKGPMTVVYKGKVYDKPHEFNMPLNYSADDYFQYVHPDTKETFRGLASRQKNSNEIVHHIMTFNNCEQEIACKLAGRKLTPQLLLTLANVSNSLNKAVDASRAVIDMSNIDESLVEGFKTTKPSDPTQKELTMVLSTKHAAAVIKRAEEKNAKALLKKANKLKDKAMSDAKMNDVDKGKEKKKHSPAAAGSIVAKIRAQGSGSTKRKRKPAANKPEPKTVQVDDAPIEVGTHKRYKITTDTKIFASIVPIAEALFEALNVRIVPQ